MTKIVEIPGGGAEITLSASPKLLSLFIEQTEYTKQQALTYIAEYLQALLNSVPELMAVSKATGKELNIDEFKRLAKEVSDSIETKKDGESS